MEEEDMTEFNEWKIHDGSDECPVPEGTMGQAILYGEYIKKDEGGKACSIDYDSWSSVFTYRTVKEPKVVDEGFVPVVGGEVWGTWRSRADANGHNNTTHLVHIQLFDNGTVTAEVEEV